MNLQVVKLTNCLFWYFEKQKIKEGYQLSRTKKKPTFFDETMNKIIKTLFVFYQQSQKYNYVVKT